MADFIHYKWVKEKLATKLPHARQLIRQHGNDALLALGKDLTLGGAITHALIEDAVEGLEGDEVLGFSRQFMQFQKGNESTMVLPEGYNPNDPKDMKKLMAMVKATQLHDFFCNVLSRADANAMFMEYWQTKRFEECGKKLYEVSAGLAEQLKFTEFRNVPVDYIRLPYPSIYVKIPHNADLFFRPMMAGERDGTVAPVIGMYISEGSYAGVNVHGNPMHQTIEEYITAGRIKQKADEIRTWRLMIVGQAQNDPEDISTFNFDVPMPDGFTVEQCIEIKKHAYEKMDPEIKKIFGEDFDARGEPTWQNIYRWVFNVVAYASMPDAERIEQIANKEYRDLQARIQKLPKNSQKREDLKDRLRMLDPDRRIILGGSIKKLDVLHRMEGKTAEGRKLLWRLLVSGHWRLQAFGHKYQEHRLIWINPYWKGPKDAEVVNPPHLIVPGKLPEQ